MSHETSVRDQLIRQWLTVGQGCELQVKEDEHSTAYYATSVKEIVSNVCPSCGLIMFRIGRLEKCRSLSGILSPLIKVTVYRAMTRDDEQRLCITTNSEAHVSALTIGSGVDVNREVPVLSVTLYRL